ncbi:MAG TPA: cyclic nucleotide-binding domain-containing protein [Anaerolineales bacterium]|nr:cyclic nucleotide-binding domain-containing protein [Anaerolineales bacterium]
MESAWFGSLGGGLATADDPETGEGVWSALKQRTNPNEDRPQANPDVIARQLEDRQGPYTILKNQTRRTYLRLNPDQYRIWERMDGRTTVQELIVENYMATGQFAHATVARLVADLRAQEMLTEPEVRVWSRVRERVEQRGLLYRLSAPARFILTQKLAINGIDGAIEALYRSVGWVFFTKPMQAVYLLLSIGGLIAFSQVVRNPELVFIGDNYVRGIALIWLASILPVVVHELGHALTVKHFGREVPRGGLMLFFGMPAAFVETTDIWMEGRKARLAVTWNGPYTGLIIAGGLSLVLYFFPAFPWNSFFFKMIGFAYFTVFMNVNPLLKYDGYYLLSDALEIPALRERSLAFVRGKFFKRLAERRRFNREEWVQTVYGLLSLVWTVYAVYLMSYFWQTRIREGVEVLFGSGYSVVARFFSLLLIAGIFSFVVLLVLGLVRLVQTLIRRFVRSGGLARHGRLGLYLALLAGGLGLGLALVLDRWAALAGTAAGLGAAAVLWSFARRYRGSLRGLSLQALAIGLALAGLQQAATLLPAMDPLRGPIFWAAVAVLVLSAAFLAWQVARTLPAVALLVGGAAGIGVFFGFGMLGTGLAVQVAGGLTAALGAWNFASLSGGARAPAALLVTAGTLLYLAARDLTAALLIAGGAIHWITAQLPTLSEDPANTGSKKTQRAVGLAVATIVRRVIAQVFFEMGRHGVHRLGLEFTRAMAAQGLKLRIEGNRFFDEEFANRTVVSLTEIYGLAFDELHGLLCRELGEASGNLAFSYGVDRLPWQNREVMLELVFSRSAWSGSLNRRHAESKDQLITFLKRVPIFISLADEDLARIASALQSEHFAADAVVMREGDPGDRFYIIERGHATFWQKDESGTEVQVHEKGAGQFFGEVALVANKPRNATVRAETPLNVLTLSQADFNQLVREYVSLEKDVDPRVYRSWLLRSMPIFDELESHELEWLALNMRRETVAAGEVLFREGDPGDRFYIVESGRLIVARTQGGQTTEIAQPTTGEYVGEIALLQNIPRTATVTAAEDTVVWSLAGEDFLDLTSGYKTLGRVVSDTGTRRMSFMK